MVSKENSVITTMKTRSPKKLGLFCWVLYVENKYIYNCLECVVLVRTFTVPNKTGTIMIKEITKRNYKKLDGLMHFQIWHNKETKYLFVIEGINNILVEHTPLYDKIKDVMKHCDTNNIPWAGVMVHHSKGCFWAGK